MKKLVFVLSFLTLFNVAHAAKINVLVPLSPAGSFNIKTEKVSGKLKFRDGKLSARKLSVLVKDLKTGMDLRDEHLQDKISDKKNKSVVIRKLKGKNGVAEMTLEVKGIKKKVKANYKVIDDKNVKFKGIVNIDQFKLSGIRYLAVGVESEVTIEAIIPYVK